jgi:hypothetical protein
VAAIRHPTCKVIHRTVQRLQPLNWNCVVLSALQLCGCWQALSSHAAKEEMVVYPGRRYIVGASCACVPQRDSIGLHNEQTGRECYTLLYLHAPSSTDVFITARLAVPNQLRANTYL